MSAVVSAEATQLNDTCMSLSLSVIPNVRTHSTVESSKQMHRWQAPYDYLRASLVVCSARKQHTLGSVISEEADRPRVRTTQIDDSSRVVCVHK
jgi:hypothetical protein